MKRRKINLIFISVLLLINFCSCEKCVTNIVEKIYVEEWNKKTLAFISSNENFSNYNSRKNNYFPQIMFDGTHINCMEEYLNHILRFRFIVLNEIRYHYKVKSCTLDISEKYHGSFIAYIIRDDKDRVYFINVSGVDGRIMNTYMILGRFEKESSSVTLDETETVDEKYLCSIVTNLESISIYSKIDFENDSLNIEFPYLKMSDDFEVF